MKKFKNRISALLIAIACICALFSVQALAAEAVNPNQPVSLTVSYKYDDAGIPGASFYLFRVADVAEDGSFTLAGDFTNFAGNINSIETADEWNQIASKLECYAAQNSLMPAYSNTTGEDGIVKFPNDGKDMMPGLYLLITGEAKFKNSVFTSQPCVICLPNQNDDGSLQYDVTVNAKPGETPIPTPAPPVVPQPPRLPQTGMLWWPVPVLALAGLLAVIIGINARRRDA